jgi:hypothetical protein
MVNASLTMFPAVFGELEIACAKPVDSLGTLA